MEDTAQWTVILVWLAVGAVFTHHYKTGLALFVGVFALVMLPGGVHVDPLAAGVVLIYGAAALMGGYILLQIWRWIGKAGW